MSNVSFWSDSVVSDQVPGQNILLVYWLYGSNHCDSGCQLQVDDWQSICIAMIRENRLLCSCNISCVSVRPENRDPPPPLWLFFGSLPSYFFSLLKVFFFFFFFFHKASFSSLDSRIQSKDRGCCNCKTHWANVNVILGSINKMDLSSAAVSSRNCNSLRAYLMCLMYFILWSTLLLINLGDVSLPIDAGFSWAQVFFFSLWPKTPIKKKVVLLWCLTCKLLRDWFCYI